MTAFHHPNSLRVRHPRLVMLCLMHLGHGVQCDFGLDSRGLHSPSSCNNVLTYRKISSYLNSYDLSWDVGCYLYQHMVVVHRTSVLHLLTYRPSTLFNTHGPWYPITHVTCLTLTTDNVLYLRLRSSAHDTSLTFASYFITLHSTARPCLVALL